MSSFRDPLAWLEDVSGDLFFKRFGTSVSCHTRTLYLSTRPVDVPLKFKTLTVTGACMRKCVIYPKVC